MSALQRVPRGRAMMVAALYVEPGGAYYGLQNVIPYGLPERDARAYPGPHPVVAHPPCERWGRYWGGGPSAKIRRIKGDDNGCFAAALDSVRKFGGVLEHPEASAAWDAFGLRRPPKAGGWVAADWCGGWTCCVYQGHYGHLAAKATWLYAHSVELPSLIWGSCGKRLRLDDGYHSADERRRSIKPGVYQQISKRQRSATPEPFRDVLLSIAATRS